ncbi:NADAR family protein [Oscillatoria sp. FACHB-1406]|nr:NADAR family protein [Oscillatoria sp. FACHB-1406]
MNIKNASIVDKVELYFYKQFTFFVDYTSPFSQWYIVPFTLNGITYNCAEQFMMYQKALLFGDLQTAKKIIAAKHPQQHQELGRMVQNFDSTIWSQYCQQIVYRGNKEKFSQHEHLLDLLLKTRGTLLVEAYRHDRKWSVGLDRNDPKIFDISQWPGKNWMGLILTKLREDLM